MATRVLVLRRSLLSTANQTLISRFYTTTVLRIRPLVAAANSLRHSSLVHAFSTHQATYDLFDLPPNRSNRPPTETVHLDGCDFLHWFVVVEKPSGEPTRDEIIDSSINTLAKVVGSYDEAKMKIYSVSTGCYFGFGSLVSEEDSYKLKEQPGVLRVFPDFYVDAENRDYGGEPFINGKAVAYDPKYHEAWIRNNEWNRRSRENMQSNRSSPGGPTPNNTGPGGAPSSNMGRPKSIHEIVFQSTPGPSCLTFYQPGRRPKPGSPDAAGGVRTRRSMEEVIHETL